MPARNTEGNRIELRIRPEDKTTISRAAALEHLDVTGFIMSKVLPEARAVIDRAEKVQLTGRDSLAVLKLLESPPKPNSRLRRAVKAGQTLR